jgi:hypothetical protein
VFLDDGFGSNQVLYALPNDGKGSFDPQLATRTKLTQTSGAFTLVGLDYDLDGKIDLLPIDDSQFTVLLNRGGGLPPDDSAAPLVQFNDSISTFMSVADLDGDQIPDLLASDLGDIPMVFLSRSTPPRTRQGLRPACPSAVYAAADLDGDGLPDTAFGCSYKNEIRFQRQLPSHLLVASTQAPPVIYSVEDPFLYALKLADLDADGRPELIFGITPNSSAGSTDYYVYHNVSQ